MYFMSSKRLLELYGVDKKMINELCINNIAEGKNFYASHNPKILFEEYNNIIHFQLNRIKYNYVIYYKKILNDGKIVYLRDNIPGEILDLSHALRNDRKKKAISGDKYIELSFIKYDISFNSYSFEELIEDQKRIVFDETGFKPWLELKYKKRLYRIIYLYVLYFFSNKYRSEDTTYIQKLKIIKYLIQTIRQHRQTGYFNSALIGKLHSMLMSVDTIDVNYKEYNETLIGILETIYNVLSTNYYMSREPKLTLNYINSDSLN